MANFVERIADTVTSVGAKRSYGDKIEIDGVELVPVSIVWFGFGGGSSEPGAAAGEDGVGEAGSPERVESGGGGGGGSVPVGAYVGTTTGPRFEPNLVAVLAVAIPLTWVAGHALARVIKALKK